MAPSSRRLVGAECSAVCTMIKTTETTKGVRRQKPSCSSVPSSETTVYYYSDNWQVLSTYVGGSLDKSFVYGNYIDEVLVMNHGADDYFYLHDHLYSPAVLFGSSGTVVERYEYDAYGRRRQYTAGWVPSTVQIWGNYYAFTGRELDWLDGGNLQVMCYRARYYDTDTGRFLQRGPLGINPSGGSINPFRSTGQYTDGMNLYKYVDSNLLRYNDPYGTMPIPQPIIPPGYPRYPFPSDPPSENGGGGYVGGEARFFVGMGKSIVRCINECGLPKKFHYTKFCFGGAIGGSIGGGVLYGMNGKKCRPENYEGWFYEIGASIGKIGIGSDIGYDGDNWGFPGCPSGTCEIGGGISAGAKFKSTWCYYVHTGGDDYKG